MMGKATEQGKKSRLLRRGGTKTGTKRKRGEQEHWKGTLARGQGEGIEVEFKHGKSKHLKKDWEKQRVWGKKTGKN